MFSPLALFSPYSVNLECVITIKHVDTSPKVLTGVEHHKEVTIK